MAYVAICVFQEEGGEGEGAIIRGVNPVAGVSGDHGSAPVNPPLGGVGVASDVTGHHDNAV